MFDVLSYNILRTPSLSRDYPDILRYVIENGSAVPSRLGETRELLDFRLELDFPDLCIVGREGMSSAFLYEEITQLLAGVHINERLKAIVPKAAELIKPDTAYGPRTKTQLLDVAAELQRFPTSRRAVVYVGNKQDFHVADDVMITGGEMPCTCVWQFHLRSGFLDMSVYMRSWDLVWGLSYDIPSFVAVQTMLARHLGAQIGVYTHTAGSGHVYDRHYSIETWPTEEKLDISFLLKKDVWSTQFAAKNILFTREGFYRPYSKFVA